MGRPVDRLCRFVSDPRNAEGLARGLLALCAAAALAAAALLVDGQLRFLPDEQDYARLAVNLAQHGMFSVDGGTPTAFRPPGYAWLLAAAAFVSTDIAVLKGVNLLLWFLAAWMTGRIARQLAGPLHRARRGPRAVRKPARLPAPVDGLYRADSFGRHHAQRRGRELARRVLAQERRVLALLLEGHRAGATAARLGVALATVRTQLRSLYEKTGCRGRAPLVALCNAALPG